jgi:hypothetical protein
MIGAAAIKGGDMTALCPAGALMMIVALLLLAIDAFF